MSGIAGRRQQACAAACCGLVTQAVQQSLCNKPTPLQPLPSPDRLVCLRAMSSNSLRPSGFCACAARSSYRSLGAEASKPWVVMQGELARGVGHCVQWAQPVRENKVDAVTGNKMSWTARGHGPPGRPCPTELQRSPGGNGSGKVLFSKGPPHPEGRPPPLLFQCRAAGAVWCTT